MAQKKVDHHVKDLLHNEKSFINTQKFGIDTLIDILPVKLQTARGVLSSLLKDMYSNLNYYYSITSHLHSSKNHTEQVKLVMNVTNSLHRLEMYLEDGKSELKELREHGFEGTTKYLESYAPPTEREKNDMFEDFV